MRWIQFEFLRGPELRERDRLLELGRLVDGVTMTVRRRGTRWPAMRLDLADLAAFARMGDGPQTIIGASDGWDTTIDIESHV